MAPVNLMLNDPDKGILLFRAFLQTSDSVLWLEIITNSVFATIVSDTRSEQI
jgi:hypothetical protein